MFGDLARGWFYYVEGDWGPVRIASHAPPSSSYSWRIDFHKTLISGLRSGAVLAAKKRDWGWFENAEVLDEGDVIEENKAQEEADLRRVR